MGLAEIDVRIVCWLHRSERNVCGSANQNGLKSARGPGPSQRPENHPRHSTQAGGFLINPFSELPNMPHRCELCGHEVPTKEGLKSHLRRQHQDRPKVFKCCCGETFASADERKVHKENSLEACEEKQQFVCKNCKKNFTRKYSLQKHKCNREQQP
ncbi:Hypothetical predicted protein [Cloeon dipterum]|uniref:C2H2-type domain-containing protein n=1 Tax=Cloeon dipterum TaxID=197152 RepID=A0A8S1E397_9INSE|nr:Hypothetical predicted protein [Cloeon dipterum]